MVPSVNRFWLHVAGATAAIMLGCWLSSGTMPPYGTYVYDTTCHYRGNGDHVQFSAVYIMLDGHPSVEWGYSVVLRRILHPLLALPLMKIFGFEAGGVLFNILLHGGSMLALALALRRYYDARASVLACWVYATYPGYAYWAGLPYSYAIIVPASIACTIGLLWWHDRPSLKRSAIMACMVGFVGLGYDLMPFFGGALLLLVAYKRRWRDLPVVLAILGAWAVFIGQGLPAIFGFAVVNGNTQMYGTIVDAWMHFWEHIDGWGSYLLRLPHVFVSNFFFSTGVFMPILFLLIVAHHLKLKVRPIFGPVALSIMLSSLAVFLFLNAAPPYGGQWQLRGTWMARIYQPWFVVPLLAVAAASVALRDTRRYKALVAAVVVTCVLGGLTIAGPYIRVYALYIHVQQNFYQDRSLTHNWYWLHELGVRPYGVCR
jgi:hypothetical protein